MAGKKRDRTDRRRRERQMRKDVRQIERLAALAPGGGPERPIEVAAAPLVETRVRSTPCPQCGGTLQWLETEARVTPEGRRRLAHARCRQCHAPRQLWFQIGSTVN